MVSVLKYGSYIREFVKKLRISNPWKYKVPLLIAFPYFFLAQGLVPTDRANLGFIAALLTTIGFAGIGYLTNDWSDRKKDQLAGKNNPTITWANWQFVSFLVLFLCMALLPWLYLPLDQFSVMLIAIELLLFALYAFKPFRFKERGILGVFTDALYAHVVPAILASYTFFLFTGKHYGSFEQFILIVAVWQFFSGVRNILYHQIVDAENDKESGTKTFALSIGAKKALNLKNFVVLPLEYCSFALFLWFVSLTIPFTWWVIGVGIIAGAIFFLLDRNNSDVPLYKRITNHFLDDLYILFVPLVFLVAMIFVKTHVTFILAVHLVVFRNVFDLLLKQVFHVVQGTKLFNWVFGFNSYLKGLVLHVGIMACYFGVFAFAYYYVESSSTDKDWFFWVQRIMGRILVGVILFHAVLVVAARKKQTLQTIKGFFLERSSPYNLALLRIVIFTVISGAFFAEVFGPFKDWTYLDDSHRVGLPLIQWLTDLLPISPEIYHTVAVVGVVLSIQILLGFKTRIALLLYVPIALYLWGVPNFFGKLNHRHIIVWVPIILMFSRCADVLSIDALIDRFKKKPIPRPNVEYALPLKFVWITLAIIYCCSGFHKIWDEGLHWMFSDNLRNQILLEWVEQYDQVKSIRIDHYPILLRFGAVGVVMMEILFPLLILKPRLRPLGTLSAWFLHLTAGYFLMIDFIQLRVVSLFLINWNGLKERIGKLLKLSDDEEEVYDWKYDLSRLKKMPLMYVAVPLVSMNLLFGILQINSWPFSGYPAYSSVAKDEVTLIRMKATTAEGRIVNVKNLGKKQKFRWENLRPFEERIVEKYNHSDTSGLSEKLDQYWELWETKLDGLEEVTQIEMYYETTSIVPEKRHIILDSGYLGKVKREVWNE